MVEEEKWKVALFGDQDGKLWFGQSRGIALGGKERPPRLGQQQNTSRPGLMYLEIAGSDCLLRTIYV